jgi:hypothetical protein
MNRRSRETRMLGTKFMLEERGFRHDLVDCWFRALDQRRIETETYCWIAHVIGVHLADGEVWIQIAPVNTPEHSLVLHVTESTSIDLAVTALRTVPLGSASYPRVISA